MEIVKNEKLLQHVIKEYHIADFFEEWKKYEQGVKLIRFPKNTFLYSRPEHRKYAYFLIAGKLSVYAVSENGSQMLVRYCDEFIFLGDMELLGYEEPSNMTKTVTECLFLALDIALMRDALMQDKKFLRFLCDNLAEKISYFARIQFHNRANSPRRKVALHILEAVEGNSVQTGRDSQNTSDSGEKILCFKENLRRTAEVLDISYRHLHRILSEFVDKGILNRTDRGYAVADWERLRELGEESSGE